jgi:hypothetical protein
MNDERTIEKQRKKKKKKSAEHSTAEIASTRGKKEKEKCINTQHHFNIHVHSLRHVNFMCVDQPLVILVIVNDTFR